jgi:hypothetical protein
MRRPGRRLQPCRIDARAADRTFVPFSSLEVHGRLAAGRRQDTTIAVSLDGKR